MQWLFQCERVLNMVDAEAMRLLGCYRSVRHAAANAWYLPGVRTQSPLQSTGAGRVQTEARLQPPSAVLWGEVHLWRTVACHLSDVPDAPGLFLDLSYLTQAEYQLLLARLIA